MAAKITTWSANTDLFTGTATISIQVPGTFATIDPTQPNFSGRQLIKLGAWLENRAAGDRISSITIKDVDGVYAPAGTTLGTLHDMSVSSSNRGITLPPNTVFTLDLPPTNKKSYIPSGMYIIITFQKLTPGVDTAGINLAWDDLT